MWQERNAGKKPQILSHLLKSLDILYDTHWSSLRKSASNDCLDDEKNSDQINAFPVRPLVHSKAYLHIILIYTDQYGSILSRLFTNWFPFYLYRYTGQSNVAIISKDLVMSMGNQEVLTVPLNFRVKIEMLYTNLRNINQYLLLIAGVLCFFSKGLYACLFCQHYSGNDLRGYLNDQNKPLS